MYLMYVDESGDTGVSKGSSKYFILSALVLHELRWYDFLDSCIEFRRKMKEATSFKLREEIHAQVMVNGRSSQFHGIERNQRLMILRNTIDWIASQDAVGVLTVIVEKDQFTDPKTIFERGWATLLQRFENTMKAHNFPGPTNADERGMVIADNTSGEDLRNLQRKMRRYNPIPSKYGSYSRNIPVKLIIEDPVFRDSRHSYFVQMVDVIAYFASQYLKPNKTVKKQGATKYFERLDPVLVKKASPADPFGRVWIKK